MHAGGENPPNIKIVRGSGLGGDRSTLDTWGPPRQPYMIEQSAGMT